MTRIDQSWTLFLDRDGVINEESPGGYVLRWEDFRFSEGALESIRDLSRCFGRIIVVSNQKCIGKGLLTERELDQIHTRMLRVINSQGGRIDRVYYCPDQQDASPCRKPNTGMGLQASKDFPEIVFSRSVLIGNNLSDMEFGRRLGMVTCFITTTQPSVELPHPWIDQLSDSLPSAARLWTGANPGF